MTDALNDIGPNRITTVKMSLNKAHDKQKIREFNRNIEQKLAEAEDEDKELSEILSTFSSAPPATCKTLNLKPMIYKKPGMTCQLIVDNESILEGLNLEVEHIKGGIS